MKYTIIVWKTNAEDALLRTSGLTYDQAMAMVFLCGAALLQYQLIKE